MKRWERRQYRLPEKRGWTAREGCNVFVADRGPLRLDYPAGWVVQPAEVSIRFPDREPPATGAALRSLTCASSRSTGMGSRFESS